MFYIHTFILSFQNLMHILLLQHFSIWILNFQWLRWSMHACMLSCFSRVWLFVTMDQPTRLLCLWDSPGKNTGVGCHAILQRIFPTQGSTPRLLGLLYWQVSSSPVTPPRKPKVKYTHIKMIKLCLTEKHFILLLYFN